MPIIGMTDQASLKPKLPRLGKLRKGGPKKKNKKGEMIYGDDLCHFRFTSDREEVQADFYKIYGDKPKVVNAYLYYHSIEENFPTWIELWAGNNVMKWRSDGENQVLWLENGEYHQGKRPHVTHEDEKMVGRLEFIIPELLAAGHKGTVVLETHSNHDIRAIAGVLAAAADEQERKGNDLGLRGIPFVLRRVEETVSVPGWGNNKAGRARVKKYLVKLEPPPNVLMIDSALEATPERPAIEAPQTDVETGEIVEGELLPEAHEDSNATPSTLKEARALWGKLWNEAKALGLGVKPLTGKPTKSEVIERGKALADRIKQAKAKFPLNAAKVAAVIEAGLSENPHSVNATMKHLKLTVDDNLSTVVTCFKLYRESRDSGADTPEAASIANAWLAGQIEPEVKQ